MAIQKLDPRATKAEIMEVFNKVAKENQALKNEVEAARKQSAAAAARPPARPEASAEAPREEAVQPAPSNGAHTVDSIVESLGALRSGFGTALSGLSARLIAEASSLDQLRRTAEAESRRLKELYGIDVGEETLDALLADYSEKARAFDEETRAMRTAFEDEMAEHQKGWKKEQEDRATALRERDALSKKGRQRDSAEYKYALDVSRNQERDTYEQEKKRLARELDDLREASEKGWTKREESIGEQERLFEDAKAKVENFPKELELAVKRAKEEGAGIARYQAKVKADLLAKEVEGRKRMFDLQAESLEAKIAKQSTQIDTLSAQLSAALKQVQDLAVKAIEGAANSSSFHAVREIAMEQAKTQQKLK